jgi:hypothetical protein
VSRVALVASEPIQAAMGGIGVRYLELARRLPAAGFDTVVVSPGTVEEAAACGLDPRAVRPFDAARVRELLADRDAVVAQGQLANDVLLAETGLPVAVDLYDPYLVENFRYLEPLGLDPYRNDHASCVLQMALGDFFLCSSAEQRLFYLGFLAALGRVHPVRAAEDPSFERLIAIVPFGCPETLPVRRPLLPERAAGERRILFGAVYDWYDVATLLAALDRLDVPGWRLFVVRHPAPGSTPQRRFAELERGARARGLWGERVVALDRVPADRRFDLLAEVDLLAAPHARSLECDLAFRTRFLDALAAGCPAVATEGGTLARLLGERRAGWTVPPGDPAALAAAIGAVLAGGEEVRATVERGRALARELTWSAALAPLVEFLRAPWRDASKSEFGFRPETRAPRDPLGFRARRWLGRRRGVRRRDER